MTPKKTKIDDRSTTSRLMCRYALCSDNPHFVMLHVQLGLYDLFSLNLYKLKCKHVTQQNVDLLITLLKGPHAAMQC